MAQTNEYQTLDYNRENKIQNSLPRDNGEYLEPAFHTLLSRQQTQIEPLLVLENINHSTNYKKNAPIGNNAKFLWSILANLTQFIIICTLVTIISLWNHSSVSNINCSASHDASTSIETIKTTTATINNADWAMS
jgi:hypothetical protein